MVKNLIFKFPVNCTMFDSSREKKSTLFEWRKSGFYTYYFKVEQNLPFLAHYMLVLWLRSSNILSRLEDWFFTFKSLSLEVIHKVTKSQSNNLLAFP